MTTFKGHKTGFKPGATNKCDPNAFGPPATSFKGRGALPEGKMDKRYPGAVADISGSNRRVAKGQHGEGAGSGTTYSGRDPFGKK
jgi:hypothetical protein